jgi:hypothetical protein
LARGFSDGDPVKDWLEAEGEIEASFKQPDAANSSKQERAAYQRMRAEFKKILAGAQDTINADTIRQAFDRAGRELKELGEFVPETVDRAGKPPQLKKSVRGGTPFRRRATEFLRSGRTKGASSPTRPTLR